MGKKDALPSIVSGRAFFDRAFFQMLWSSPSRSSLLFFS